MAVYGLYNMKFDYVNPKGATITASQNWYSRCVGNGGFPAEVNMMPETPRSTQLQYYDDRLYLAKITLEGEPVESFPIGFNGFARCEIDDNTRKITLSYWTTKLDGQTGTQMTSHADKMFEEEFVVTPATDTVTYTLRDVNRELTKIINCI